MRQTIRTHLLSATAALVVLALCVAYLLGPVLQTGRGGSAVDVVVHLPRTGGLFDGAGVSYRGVVVGKIVDLALEDDGVVATARITSDVAIPADVRVRVRTLSAVGEQYLDFAPRTPAGPFLADGDEVSAEATDVPMSVGEVALSLDRLATELDPRLVRRVLHETAVGLYGAEDDLRRLVRDGGAVIDTVEDNLGLIQRFLTSTRTVLRIGVDSGGAVRRAVTSYASFARWLRGFDPELFAILRHTPDDLKRLRVLVTDLAAVLPAYLDSQRDVDDVLVAHDPHLRTLLQTFPDGIDAFASAFRDGKIYFDMILRRGPTCDYDVEERSPHDVTYRELVPDGRCPVSPDSPARGAQNAPPPRSSP
jgi:virulence factor Mce-like protein